MLNVRWGCFLLAFAVIGMLFFNENARAVNQFDSQDLSPFRSSMQKLARVIGQGLQIQNQSSNDVFNTSYDWHSSVHAHWALLSMARISGDNHLRDQILTRLSGERWTAVRDILNSNPQFEMPYGQSWLLLLLSELQKNRIDELDSVMLHETADRVTHWLLETPFPEGAQCRGDYSSWMFNYLLVKKAGLSSEWQERLNILDAKFQSSRCEESATSDRDFSSAGILSQVFRTNEYQAPESLGSLTASLGVLDFSNCHVLGQIVTLHWPEAVLAAQGDIHRQRDFQNFIGSYMGNERLWKNDFNLVSHWIPQFLWFGIWLSLGEP